MGFMIDLCITEYHSLPMICIFRLSDSVVVLLTPLVSLMFDQKKFSQKEITVEFVGEAQDNEQTVFFSVKGEIQLVYFTPESVLDNNRFCAFRMLPEKAKSFGF